MRSTFSRGPSFGSSAICLGGASSTLSGTIIGDSAPVSGASVTIEELGREKLVKSLNIACRKRHISVEQIERVADQIVMEAESEFEKEIPSIMLGKKVMAALEKLDEVAYIRYASVYRRFRDAGQFMNEVERLIGRE